MKKFTFALLMASCVCSFGQFAHATTLYIVAPEETNVSDPYVLSNQGLNHSLLLASYIRNQLIPSVGLNSVYFLTGSPEYMRSNAGASTGCTDVMNENYLSNPTACYYDTTAFATLDPTVIYYGKLIHEQNAVSGIPQKLIPSSSGYLTDYSNVLNDITYAESTGYSTIVLSYPSAELIPLIGSFTGCAVPGGFNGSAGQIVKMNVNGTTCTSAPTLINDGITSSTAYPNYMNQNTSVTGQLASATDKYVIFIRHGEKWDLESTGGELTCLGLNRALAFSYFVKQKYGNPDVIMGASLTSQMSPPPANQPTLAQYYYASRVLEKIMPYAVLSGQSIRALPLNLEGTQLQDTINSLVNTPANHLIIFAWESANAARIADAIIQNNWTIPTGTNNPFYWNSDDYEQNIVLHYHCNTGGTACTLQNDYHITSEDYGNILPSWCGNPINS